QTLFTELNVFENFEPLVPEEFKSSAVVFLGNLHPKLQKSVILQMQNPQLVGLDTMNYWIEQAKPELLEVLKLINIFIINDSEARELTGEHNIPKVAKIILELMDNDKNPTLVIKCGEYGVLMFSGNKLFNLPAFP